ncbi:MAG: UDP-3-O-(3-hydroxymyristoyl)glucosamine N-acyltransferase [Gammaproteobacteria bacterium]
MPVKLGEIAEAVDAELDGNSECLISGVGTLKNAKAGELSFFSNRRYFSFLGTTEASAVILSAADGQACPANKLIVADPYLAYVKAVRFLYPETGFQPGCHEAAVISTSATVDPGACIGANTYVGEHVTVGKDVYIGPGCIIESNAVIDEGSCLVAGVTICHDVRIGKNVRLHPGVVIGADGFGIANDNGRWLKIPQLGSVVIHDDVEIGANSTVDRGALEDTVVGEGVKIDNQVQIGHNVIIGDHTAIAGCVGVAGSVHIGKRCMIGGLSALSGHIDIADDVIITGMSGVSNSIREAGVYSSGIPATDNRLWRRNITRFKHLDELARRVKALEEKNQ